MVPVSGDVSRGTSSSFSFSGIVPPRRGLRLRLRLQAPAGGSGFGFGSGFGSGIVPLCRGLGFGFGVGFVPAAGGFGFGAASDLDVSRGTLTFGLALVPFGRPGPLFGVATGPSSRNPLYIRYTAPAIKAGRIGNGISLSSFVMRGCSGRAVDWYSSPMPGALNSSASSLPVLAGLANRISS